MSYLKYTCSSGLSVCTHEAHILETLHAKHTRSNSNLDCITTLTKSGTHENRLHSMLTCLIQLLFKKFRLRWSPFRIHGP